MSTELYDIAKCAESFDKYRPHYTDDVARYVINYMREKNSGESSDEKHNLMVEVGCGTGQATNTFAPYFKNVLATDLSPAQVRRAAESNQLDHVTYQVGSAEAMEVADNTVDLLLCAQSVHCFDLPKFFAEAKRVLKPGGCLAAIGNFMGTVTPKGDPRPSCDAPSLIFDHVKTLTTERYIRMMEEVRSRYAGVYEAIPWQEKQRSDHLSIEFEWSLDDFEGYEESIGWFHEYVQKHGGKFDKQRLKDKMKALFGIEDDDVRFKVVFDVFMLVTRVP